MECWNTKCGIIPILISSNLSLLGLILRRDTLIPLGAATLEDFPYVLILKRAEDEAPGTWTWSYLLEWFCHLQMQNQQFSNYCLR